VAIVRRSVVTVTVVTVATGPGPQGGRGIGGGRSPKRAREGPQSTPGRGSGRDSRGQRKLERKIGSHNGGPKEIFRGARKGPQRRSWKV
jgi:hypothetical protein